MTAPRSFRGTFAFKLVVLVALIAAGDVLFYQLEWTGAAFGLAAFLLVGAVAAAHPAVLRQKPARTALFLAGLFAFALAFRTNLLAWALFAIAVSMAALLPRATGFDDAWRWLQRLFVHVLHAFAGPLPVLARRKRIRKARAAQGRGFAAGLALLAVPLAGTAIFVTLFAASNPVIGRWLDGLSLPGPDIDTVIRVLLWLVLAWVAWAALRPKFASRTVGLFDGTGDSKLPGISTGSVLLSLIAFNAVFLLQNAMDALWLWGLVPLPEGISLASYAHRSAHPLVATALLTAGFVLVALRPRSATAAHPAIRKLVVLWIAQNLFLLANAVLRTMAYVDAYSLTVFRIAAMIWMALVGFGLVTVAWRMLAARSSAWLVNINAGALALVFGATCFVDLGAVAAQWNVRHAREVDGEGAFLDLCYLRGLEGSALIALVELERQTPPSAFRDRVQNVRRAVHYELIDQVAGGGGDIMALRRLRAAENLLGGKVGTRPDRSTHLCDGRPAPSRARAYPDGAHALDGEVIEVRGGAPQSPQLPLQSAVPPRRDDAAPPPPPPRPALTASGEQ